MNDDHLLGYKIARQLSHGLDLKPDVAERLRAARETALARQRVAEPKSVAVLGGNVAGWSIERVSPVAQWLLPLVILIFGLFSMTFWHQYLQVTETEEIDSAVLTGDLPIDAYLDKGFHTWLKRSSP